MENEQDLALPWKVEVDSIVDANGFDVTTVDWIWSKADHATRTAFIVHAANNHHRLLKALKEAVRIGFVDEECRADYEKIIAAAEEQL